MAHGPVGKCLAEAIGFKDEATQFAKSSALLGARDVTTFESDQVDRTVSAVSCPRLEVSAKKDVPSTSGKIVLVLANLAKRVGYSAHRVSRALTGDDKMPLVLEPRSCGRRTDYLGQADMSNHFDEFERDIEPQ